MIAILIVIIGLAMFAFLAFAPGIIEDMAGSSADTKGRRIPPEMEEHRDKLYRECLIAAQQGKFVHDHLTYRLKTADFLSGLALTDDTWAYGIQPLRPLGREDGFAFTREQSDELRKLLAPLRVGLQEVKAKKLNEALDELKKDEK